MAESKKPPRQTRTSRNAPPRASRAPKGPDDTTRLLACEKSVRAAHVAITRLQQRVDAMRAELDELRQATPLGKVPGRLVPPPLPLDMGTEIIVVDEGDVTLESIRPKGR